MDHLARCRAMAAFCRQRSRMDDEAEEFWITEAELWTERLELLISRARVKRGRVTAYATEAISKTRTEGLKGHGCHDVITPMARFDMIPETADGAFKLNDRARMSHSGVTRQSERKLRH